MLLFVVIGIWMLVTLFVLAMARAAAVGDAVEVEPAREPTAVGRLAA